MFSYLLDRISSMNSIMYCLQHWSETQMWRSLGCKIIVNFLYIALIWTRTLTFCYLFGLSSTNISTSFATQNIFTTFRNPSHAQLPPVYQQRRPLASWTLATRPLHRHRGNLHGRAKSRKVPLQKPRPMEHPQESAKLQRYLCKVWGFILWVV